MMEKQGDLRKQDMFANLFLYTFLADNKGCNAKQFG